MNPYDRNNLNFLLNVGKEDLDKWYAQASQDDLAYAIELIRAARSELIEQELEALSDIQDVSDATVLLKRFTSSK